MTYKAALDIDPGRTLGTIDERIYGYLTELMGRVIHGGLYDPDAKQADPDGFRPDVREAAEPLRPSVLRWPGGNFASGYHWRDGIGPVDSRPARRDLAWGQLETNSFGTEEFLTACRKLGAEPYINLNLGTGTIDEALQWLEYCNADNDDIPEVELRRAGPHPDPHGVRIWGLGNEMYGWWQHGAMDAANYGVAAREYGKLLRWTDRSIKIVVNGATDPDWNTAVVDETARVMDWLSLHFYWRGEPHQILAGPAKSEEFLVSTFEQLERVRQRLSIDRPLGIAVDEWGVWSKTFAEQLTTEEGRSRLMADGLGSLSDTSFEERYDLIDALAFAEWFNVMWRHPEKVTMANQAHLVNTIAPILVTDEGVLRQTTYWPIALARAWAGSQALDVGVRSEGEVPGLDGATLPALDAAATLADGHVHISLVNRSLDDACEVTFAGAEGARVFQLWREDPATTNTDELPNAIAPVESTSEGGTVVLPPHSHATLVVQRA
jgi:alpha-L-arabinofuranosidase